MNPVPASDIVRHLRIFAEVTGQTQKSVCEAVNIRREALAKLAWLGGYIPGFLAQQVYDEIGRRVELRPKEARCA